MADAREMELMRQTVEIIRRIGEAAERLRGEEKTLPTLEKPGIAGLVAKFAEEGSFNIYTPTTDAWLNELVLVIGAFGYRIVSPGRNRTVDPLYRLTPPAAEADGLDIVWENGAFVQGPKDFI